MVAVPGFPVGRHSDGPFAGHRAFMLANAAADASLRIDIGLLKPYLNLNPGSGRWGRFKRCFFIYFQPPFPVGDDSSPAVVRCRIFGDVAVIIAGGVFGRIKS